ncbi:MAG TPA: hypothetical protein VN704_02320 [Verrucomicrobiae bacterium]|nr:hypothetical protein [Verrucomicrobiae bacterium]
MIHIQYDLFESTEEVLFKEIQKAKESCDSIRKSMFARHNDLFKLYIELNHRLEIIEKCICIGSNKNGQDSDAKAKDTAEARGF